MKSPANQATQGQVISAFLAILVILAATGGVWYWMQKQAQPVDESQTRELAPGEPTPIPTPTPTPTKLKHGKETYHVSGGGEPGPDISSIGMDPLDPVVGSTQIITVQASDTVPVSSIIMQVRTDTKTTPVTLTRVDGTEFAGTWEARWTIPETYTYNYIFTVVAKSSEGTVSFPVTVRERK